MPACLHACTREGAALANACGLMPARPHACVQVRCANVNAFFTYSLYKNICRGLFEKSKLLFSFTLCIKLMAGDNRINTAELRFLLAGATSTDTRLSNPASDWLVESSWLDLSDLAKLPAFPDFDREFHDNVGAWKALFDSNRCCAVCCAVCVAAEGAGADR